MLGLGFLLATSRKGSPGGCDVQGSWVVGTRERSVDGRRGIVHSVPGLMRYNGGSFVPIFHPDTSLLQILVFDCKSVGQT